MQLKLQTVCGLLVGAEMKTLFALTNGNGNVRLNTSHMT